MEPWFVTGLWNVFKDKEDPKRGVITGAIESVVMKEMTRRHFRYSEEKPGGITVTEGTVPDDVAEEVYEACLVRMGELRTEDEPYREIPENEDDDEATAEVRLLLSDIINDMMNASDIQTVSCFVRADAKRIELVNLEVKVK
jgi:hypothetical protein